jgi:hypothetical protein
MNKITQRTEKESSALAVVFKLAKKLSKKYVGKAGGGFEP